MVLTASMIGALHENDNEGKKLASLLVIPLGKAFSDIPLSLHGIQMVVKPGSLFVVVAQFL